MAPDGISIKATSDEVLFRVDERIYSQKVLFKAAYTFLDRFYVMFSYADEVLCVQLKPKQQDFEPSSVVGEFYNELLHQVLRLQVLEDTKNIRELIISRALHSAVLELPTLAHDERIDFYSHDEHTSAAVEGYQEDRLGISRSWLHQPK